MVAFFNDRVFDNGLTVLDTEADKFYVCSAQPATYAEATSTYALGNKTSISIGSPTDGTTGRKVVVGAITSGSVTANGTATHYAIVDSSNSRLLVASALTQSQVLTSGNTFSTGTIDFTIPDATA